MQHAKPALPLGWHYPDADTAQDLLDELHRELPPGHLLFEKEVATFAWRQGGTDDVLFRHLKESDKFTVIHITWLGRTEINDQHPTIEFQG